MKTKLLAPAMLIALFFSACATRQPTLSTVPKVDLSRYEGRWYEVARYPNWFQRHCAKDVTADYKAQPDGSIRVTNACVQKNGKTEQAIGRAVVVPDSGNAKLKVSFFGPFQGDYWIIGLDERNYSWAVVGHPSRRYLWILSRQPTMSPETYSRILQLIKKAGYDPDRLIKSES